MISVIHIGSDELLYVFSKFLYFNVYDSFSVFFFQAEDGIRDLVRSRGLGDVYKRQAWSGFTTKKYKAYKDLKKENLRDHMTNLELVLNLSLIHI